SLSLVFNTVFFFQAEDGIRDFHVTGVQTCALPIYANRRWGIVVQRARNRQRAVRTQRRLALHGHRPPGNLSMSAGAILATSVSRSEERRVGKECRSRW